jgi:hypothetical protein
MKELGKWFYLIKINEKVRTIKMIIISTSFLKPVYKTDYYTNFETLC